MAIKIDIKQNSRIVHNKNGIRLERIAIVSGLEGSAESMLYAALTADELPRYGDDHPTIPDITLNSLSAEPLAAGKMRVVMSYYNDPTSAGGAAAAVASVSSSTVTEPTLVDADGNRLETRFRDTLDAYSHSQWWTAEVERARWTLDFSYETDAFPKAEIDTYINTVNATTWNGYAAKTLFCAGIDASGNGNGYRVRFSFAYNPDTWQFVAALKGYTLPLNAHDTSPDGELDLATGVRRFDVYRAVDFTPLGFVL